MVGTRLICFPSSSLSCIFYALWTETFEAIFFNMAIYFVWIRANYYCMIGTRLLTDGSERIDLTNWQHGSE
ncbi:hypothetical protein HDV62DRAFT_259220 [Trichoderma sp. SZMC 28011]